MSALFSQVSRYRKLPDVVVVDSAGRATTSKGFRLLTPAGGTFTHTVSDTDRLDHLAFKYYDQPRDWWRIMDANPGFLSPDSLIGTDRFVTTQVPLSWDGSSPPWTDLLGQLDDRSGIEGSVLGTDDQLMPMVHVVEGPVAFDIPPALTASLDISTRTQQIPAGLAAALAVHGLVFSASVRVAKFEAAAWRIIDLADRTVRTFRHLQPAGQLNVHASTFRFDWILTVSHNRAAIAPTDLLVVIAANGFAAGQPTEVHRIGKPIVIPPRVV